MRYLRHTLLLLIVITVSGCATTGSYSRYPDHSKDDLTYSYYGLKDSPYEDTMYTLDIGQNLTDVLTDADEPSLAELPDNCKEVYRLVRFVGGWSGINSIYRISIFHDGKPEIVTKHTTKKTDSEKSKIILYRKELLGTFREGRLITNSSLKNFWDTPVINSIDLVPEDAYVSMPFSVVECVNATNHHLAFPMLEDEAFLNFINVLKLFE